MNTLDITQQLQELLTAKFDVPKHVIESNLPQPLMGQQFNFDSIKMVYLFFEIMQTFNIRFNPQDISDYNFSSIKDIANIIQSHICRQ